jgi:hypothetical protein
LDKRFFVIFSVCVSASTIMCGLWTVFMLKDLICHD